MDTIKDPITLAIDALERAQQQLCASHRYLIESGQLNADQTDYAKALTALKSIRDSEQASVAIGLDARQRALDIDLVRRSICRPLSGDELSAAYNALDRIASALQSPAVPGLEELKWQLRRIGPKADCAAAIREMQFENQTVDRVIDHLASKGWLKQPETVPEGFIEDMGGEEAIKFNEELFKAFYKWLSKYVPFGPHDEFTVPEFMEMLDDICLAPRRVPPGCMIVPIEPTEEMIQAGWRRFDKFAKPENRACNMYRAMLSAAPEHESGV